LEENGNLKRGGMTGRISFWRGKCIELLKDVPIPTFLAVKVPMSTLNGIFLHKFVLPVPWRFTNPLNLSADEGG
jgi:hypothetical protein